MEFDPQQNVLDYAGVGRRFAALLIDGLLALIVLIVISAALGDRGSCDSSTWIGLEYTLDGKASFYGLCGASAGLFMLAGIVYFILFEWLFMGTVGKLVTGLRVSTLDGLQIGFTASLVRNLLRIVDAIPFFIPYLVGAIIIWSTRLNQRLGDQAARTVVVTSSSLP